MNIKQRIHDYIAQQLIDPIELLSDIISNLPEASLRKAIYDSEYGDALDLDDLEPGEHDDVVYDITDTFDDLLPLEDDIEFSHFQQNIDTPNS